VVYDQLLSQLQRSNLPNKWWYSIDGKVSPALRNLREIRRIARRAGIPYLYILNSRHADRTTARWILFSLCESPEAENALLNELKGQHEAQSQQVHQAKERVLKETEERLQEEREQLEREKERLARERSDAERDRAGFMRSDDARSSGQKRFKTETDYAEALGLQGRQTRDDIRKAYRKLIQQYHPDKVAALGPRLRRVAEEESKTINEAYDYFRAKYHF
jgi:DnaJ-domain-containing protein 1